jgi:hypothetical protein
MDVRLPRVKVSPHGVHPLRPFFMKHEIPQAGVALEDQPEEILGLSLMPVCGMNYIAETGDDRFCLRHSEDDMDLSSPCIPVKNVP